jgi:hypothetical protein
MPSNLEANPLSNTKQSASAEAGVGLEMEASMKVEGSMTVSLNKLYKTVKNSLTTLLLAAIHVVIWLWYSRFCRKYSGRFTVA